ncbi:hypothetical protein ACVWXL_001790 [Bradyrhizobium sp. GM22.5]
MVAVVDGEIGGAVEIGTATAAGLLRRFVHGDLEAGIGKSHGDGEAGDSSANDVSCFLHQMRAYRSRMAIRVIFDTRTGSRGALNPRAIRRSRMA